MHKLVLSLQQDICKSIKGKTDVKRVLFIWLKPGEAGRRENMKKKKGTWEYVKLHWQLYVVFLMPALILTIIFKYIPMAGVVIGFQKYNPVKGMRWNTVSDRLLR